MQSVSMSPMMLAAPRCRICMAVASDAARLYSAVLTVVAA